MYTKWLVALLVSIAVVNCQNTTTHSPNVTTSTVPSTTSKATQSTTVAPVTTTTTLKPTTTPAPKTTTTVAPPPPTPPKPESWNGTVTDQNNTVCIMAKFAVQIDIAYNNTNSSQLLTGFIVPSDAVVDHSMSHCSANESEPQVMAIGFSQEEHTSANLTLVFNKTNNDIHVQKVELSFKLTKELFPGFHDPSLYGTVVTFAKDDLSLFKVASAHSYVCSAAQTADLGSHETGINDVKIDFLDSQVEAYMETQDKDNRGKFDSAIDCKSTEISDVVPIAVGAALAGLVVIVLIAYFIGRRRSRRLAYQSV